MPPLQNHSREHTQMVVRTQVTTGPSWENQLREPPERVTSVLHCTSCLPRTPAEQQDNRVTRPFQDLEDSVVGIASVSAGEI